MVQTVSTIQGVGLIRGSDCQYDTGCGFDTWFRLSTIQGVGLIRGSDCQYDTGCGFNTWFRLSVRYKVWV